MFAPPAAALMRGNSHNKKIITINCGRETMRAGGADCGKFGRAAGHAKRSSKNCPAQKSLQLPAISAPGQFRSTAAVRYLMNSKNRVDDGNKNRQHDLVL